MTIEEKIKTTMQPEISKLIQKITDTSLRLDALARKQGLIIEDNAYYLPVARPRCKECGK